MKIQTKEQHEKALAEVLTLMNKGEGNLTEKENERVKSLALDIQKYEQKLYPVVKPKTLEGMIELKMYELRLNQRELAKKLNLSTAKLSLILNGKQKPDIAFLKGIRNELKIPADFILDHV